MDCGSPSRPIKTLLQFQFGAAGTQMSPVESLVVLVGDLIPKCIRYDLLQQRCDGSVRSENATQNPILSDSEAVELSA